MAEHTPSKYDVRARADGFWEYGVPPTRSRPRIDTHAARYETWQVDGEYGSRVTATEVGSRRTVKKKVQDKADTGDDDDDDDHIIGPFVVSVSCGPAPTVPVSHVKVEEEMCKKDEFSPATSERGVDVQDKVDEADVANDDCPRDPRKMEHYNAASATTASPSEEECDEPKKWGPTQQRRARWKRNLSNTEYNHRMRLRKKSEINDVC